VSPLESLANIAYFAGNNTVYNLTFIPEDKLDWKPEPTASSALEIVNHVVGAVRSMLPVVRGGEWAPPEFTPATNLAEAQELLRSTTEEYVAALKQAKAEDLSRSVTVYGRFTLPVARAASMPVIDLVHHHGQIAYLQTLLGDQVPHFDPRFVGE
jgi:uncharacterized damage-inducible protein DinB